MSDRFKCVKTAEFDLLMSILREVDIQAWAESGVPGVRCENGVLSSRDKVALKRARSAVQNITKVLFNMASKRAAFLPEGHEHQGWEPPTDMASVGNAWWSE
jgi:hypothetical protein